MNRSPNGRALILEDDAYLERAGSLGKDTAHGEESNEQTLRLTSLDVFLAQLPMLFEAATEHMPDCTSECLNLCYPLASPKRALTAVAASRCQGKSSCCHL